MSEAAIVKFDPSDPSQLYMEPSLFAQLQRVATMLSTSGAIPKHLQGNVADCAIVAAQAFRWRMDVFAVASSVYVLQGKLGYEGKLIAAVVNASPKLATKLNYEYGGEGKKRWVRVYGTLKGEERSRDIFGSVEQWATANKQWQTMPDQMLAYRGAREWARRHMPETLLGIHAEEELPEVVQAEKVTVLAPASLTDFGDVVSAKDDPKPKVVDAEPLKEHGGAEFVKPEAETKKAEKKAPILDPQEAEIDKLFS
jgi:hypothetical protein